MKTLLILLLLYSSCHAQNFCEVYDIIGTYLCPTTTTTALTEPVPEYCGEIGIVELNKLLSRIFEGDYDGHDTRIFWDDRYRLVSKASLECFLQWYSVPGLADRGADCADYCRIMQGKFSEWSPNTAFGIVVLGWDEKTKDWGRHCKNVFVDCEKKIYFVEPQNNAVTEYDEEADTIIMRER
jgi:hypothetical protein